MTQVHQSVRDRLKNAIDTKHIKQIGVICDALRFRYNMKYQQIADLVKELTGLEQSEWDALLEEYEDVEARE